MAQWYSEVYFRHCWLWS